MRRFFHKQYLPFYTFACVMIFYHLLIAETYGDALTYFSKVLDTYSLPAYLSMRYTQWTSRLVIESVLVYVARSELLWKIIDCCMWVLLVVSMSDLTPGKNRLRNRWILVSLWLMVPLWEMSSAGWIATTINYSWPLALGVFSMTVIARIFRGQPVRWYHAACGILAAVYAANAEQMCIVLLAVFGVALLYQLHTRRAERNAVILLAVFCCIIVAELLFILTCPGNQNRTLAETQTWNPAFSQLQLGQKLQLGIVDTLYILQAGWVLLYGLLCLLLLVLAWRQRKMHPLCAAMACIPFGYACVYSFGGYRQYGLQALTRDFVTQENMPYELSWPALIQCLVVLGCILFVLYRVYQPHKTEGRVVIGTLLLGGATRAVLGFSPTLYVSSGRTFLFLYACIVWVNASLISRLAADLPGRRRRALQCAGVTLTGLSVLRTLYILIGMA